MDENYSKSKLKRKKWSVEDVQPETSCSGELAAARSAFPAAARWSGERLPAVEALWALSLESALPHLENWALVPELPHPSTARPTALKLEGRRWCDLSEEVAAFPEAAPPFPSTSSSPDPLGLGSTQQELSAPTQPLPEPTDRRLSPHSRQSPDGTTASFQALTKRPGGAAASPGLPSVEGEETGPVVYRQLLTNQARVSDSRVFLQEEAESKEEELLEDREEEEVQKRVRGDGGAAAGGGGGLQSCPMCLLVFPEGFTQMDCDGHLAQCLSEVNVDVIW